MSRKLAAATLSALLLSTGWLGMTGLTLLVGFVPLLWISGSYDGSRRSWRGMFGWATLTFVLWNALTVWWIWNATPVGPFAATLASTTLNMIAFMLFHTVSKKAPAALAYTTLAAAWIATEYWYTTGEFSWPWLVLGNGFSHEVWAVQWYEYTGVFGGSLWVLASNMAVFEALRRRTLRRSLAGDPVRMEAARRRDGPRQHRPAQRRLLRQIPRRRGTPAAQHRGAAARGSRRGAVHPAARNRRTGTLLGAVTLRRARRAFWLELTDSLRTAHPEAMLVTGANTLRRYEAGAQTPTARYNRLDGSYYDIFNTAVGIDSAGRVSLHHKGRLVIGVENTPTWVFDVLKFLVIDLGGTLGQIGMGQHGTAFGHAGATVGPAICYEGLYGDFCGDFVRRGAQFLAIISNDGWWGDTPGYKHLFSISRLRAIEHRRAIARSANTGRSGFISARGDVGQTLGWEQRGVITADVPLSSQETFYTRYGDYIARIAEYVLLLCMLYFVAYRVKRRNYLVK